VSSQDDQAVAQPTGDTSTGGSSLLPPCVPDVPAPGARTPRYTHPNQLTDGKHRGQVIDVPADGRRKAHTRRRKTPKPPKDSKVYKMAIAAMALRYQGVKWPEISEQLGLQRNTLETYVKLSRKKGWLADVQFVDPDDALEFTIKDRVISNLRTVLDERTDDGALTGRAVDVTVEAAKGTGMFKQHQAVKVDNTSTIGVALRVQVEHAPMGTAIQIRDGSIGGTPAIVGEVVEPAE
jgi:hypothetical protein